MSSTTANVLDLVFVCDCTASMSSYLASAQQNIKQIIEEIIVAESTNVQFALVTYRDHPPQEKTYVVESSEFTTSHKRMKELVDRMAAVGGGDGPESVVDGLHAALHLPYRKDAVRVVVLIADAPPHGLEPSGDEFPNGCPCGHDPMDIVRQMAEKGIVIYAVGVEPNIGGYTYGRDFMQACAKMTDGQFLPLTSASLLATVIVGGSLEEVTLKRVQDQVDAERQALVRECGKLSEEELVTKLTDRLQKKNIQTQQLKVDSVYTDYDMSNVLMFTGAPSGTKLTDMKKQLKPAINKHINTSSSSYSGYGGGYGALPPSPALPAPASSYGAMAPASSYGAMPPPRPTMAKYSSPSTGAPLPLASPSAAPSVSYGALPVAPMPAPAQQANYGYASISYDQVSRLVNKSARKDAPS